eukprot:CAMPEP_0179995136 /NCGR_PEP_ID=MMETSP0984-20121128/6927_1 /TAXON_ID=483367 /ORGANISM="non described non described, Strain CCMP 2436" /LENGTH=199 /DNA_ID=CAMNT_0021914613 /DNA_START=223 /DNA_END=820 /DNA_ORIENTATION=+
MCFQTLGELTGSGTDDNLDIYTRSSKQDLGLLELVLADARREPPAPVLAPAPVQRKHLAGRSRALEGATPSARGSLPRRTEGPWPLVLSCTACKEDLHKGPLAALLVVDHPHVRLDEVVENHGNDDAEDKPAPDVLPRFEGEVRVLAVLRPGLDRGGGSRAHVAELVLLVRRVLCVSHATRARLAVPAEAGAPIVADPG